MDKAAIKTFAIESRRKMIESVKYQASLIGITADGIAEPISKGDGRETYDYGVGTHTIYDDDIKKRESLVREVKNKGFENIIEEVTYTWFNRIIAIRYLEVNDYLPTRVRVLSSEIQGKTEPDIITEALDLDFTKENKEKIFRLKDENKLDELFQFLFILQCNKLNEILPGLFEKTDDFMELLLDIKFTDEEGIIRKLVDSIVEDDFRHEVEIIGWLYQFYNSEKKDEVNNALKSKPIKKEDIPAATQLFTPEWIVRYMVDNSLGRYWIERNQNTRLNNKLAYYFEEAPQTEEVSMICNELRSNDILPEDLKFFDPCMGSGHILVYAFDVFLEIYKDLGYSEKEIPNLILENNLYGLDIDNRAYQLAYFTLMMKGREYNRGLFYQDIQLNIFPIKNSEMSQNTLKYIEQYDFKLSHDISYLCSIFENAEEFGSLIQVKNLNFENLEFKLNDLIKFAKTNLLDFNIKYEIENNIFSLINQAKVLSMKYEVVVTNPPYMNKYDAEMKKFSKDFYKDYSKDLFSMFIYRNFDFCTEEGYTAFMTPMVWMFIKNFEKLRKFIIDKKSFISLIEMEYHTLWEIDAHVPACTFVLSNQNYNSKYNATFLKLTDFTGGIEVQNQKTLAAINFDVDYLYITNSNNFNKVPGSPIAYWADKHVFEAFQNGTPLIDIGDVKQGLATADNNRFLRLWYEVDSNNIGLYYSSCDESINSNLKWFPYNKGGDYKKWYGNQTFVVNWENDGYEIRNFKDARGKLKSRPQNSNFYFHESLSWSKISSGSIAFRYYPKGFLFDVAGCSVFVHENMEYIMGFLNSNVSKGILDMISPTLNYEVGHVSSVPIIFDEDNKIRSYVRENIQICKDDWDDYETSWEFKSHPLIRYKCSTIEESFNKWTEHKLSDFNKLKRNEIELNKIFSDIYSIDVDSNVEDKYVSVTKSDYEKDIKSLISYAVGCMFGRFSLDIEGLAFAGGTIDLNKYKSLIPDDDNIIPILDNEYFEDDIVGKFSEFIKIVWGEESLEENLIFIANALNTKGSTSREMIRNYFLNGFYQDHIKTYKKCPIYWLFDSGKQNGFKCLIYMHRYEPNLVARVRTDYLFKTQKKIEESITRCENIINNSSADSEKSKATKDKNRLIKQLTETREYDEALSHIANKNIMIDLDDGVKVNYAKFQNVEVHKEGQKSKKVQLLKKF